MSIVLCFVVGCASLAHRMTHGSRDARQRACEEYDELSREEKAAVQEELVFFAKFDENGMVRQAAAQCVNSEAILIEIAKRDNNQYVRRSAVKNRYFANPQALATIAKTDCDDEVRKIAIGKMTAENALLEVIQGHSTRPVRLTGVDRLETLKYRHALATVAKENDDIKVRAVAIKSRELSDPNVLASIAIEEKNEANAKDAVLQLWSSQKALAKVAQQARYRVVRLEAVRRLKLQPVLAEVAKNDEDAKIRKLALSNLTDDLCLADVAEFATDDAIATGAIKKLEQKISEITDQRVLRVISQKAAPTYRKSAIKKLTQQEELVALLKEDCDESLVGELIEGLTDQSALAIFAEYGTLAESRGPEHNHLRTMRQHLRRKAFDKITDPAILVDFVVSPQSSWSTAAFRRLTTEESLEAVVKRSASRNVRIAALNKIEDQFFLAEIAMNDRDESVRDLALSRVMQEDLRFKIKNGIALDAKPLVFRKSMTFSGNYYLDTTHQKNYTFTSPIRVLAGRTLVLDLCGGTLDAKGIIIEQGAEVTLLNGTILGLPEFGARQSFDEVQNKGSLTLKSVTVGTRIVNEGKLVLEQSIVGDMRITFMGAIQQMLGSYRALQEKVDEDSMRSLLGMRKVADWLVDEGLSIDYSGVQNKGSCVASNGCQVETFLNYEGGTCSFEQTQVSLFYNDSSRKVEVRDSVLGGVMNDGVLTMIASSCRILENAGALTTNNLKVMKVTNLSQAYAIFAQGTLARWASDEKWGFSAFETIALSTQTTWKVQVDNKGVFSIRAKSIIANSEITNHSMLILSGALQARGVMIYAKSGTIQGGDDVSGKYQPYQGEPINIVASTAKKGDVIISACNPEMFKVSYLPSSLKVKKVSSTRSLNLADLKVE